MAIDNSQSLEDLRDRWGALKNNIDRIRGARSCKTAIWRDLQRTGGPLRITLTEYEGLKVVKRKNMTECEELKVEQLKNTTEYEEQQVVKRLFGGLKDVGGPLRLRIRQNTRS